MPESDWCSFTTCSSNKSGKLKFFSFPVHRPDLCHKWLETCQNEILRELPLSLLQHRRVCELHFERTCFNTAVKGRPRLSKNAVPTLGVPERIEIVSTTSAREANNFPRINSVNEMDSLDSTCFVCDKRILSDKWKYKLKTTATKKRNVPVSDLIQLLVGDEFQVLVGERDAVCSDCMKSLNNMDALTDQLAEVKTQLSRLLNVKYNLTSDEAEFQVEFDSSTYQDTETLLNCEKCDFQTEREKEYNEHIKIHTVSAKTSKKPPRSHKSFSKFNNSHYELTPSKQKISFPPASPKPTKNFAANTANSLEKSKNKFISDNKKESPNTVSLKSHQLTGLPKKNKINQVAHKKGDPETADKKVKFVFQCSVCNLICKSKTGMIQHARRIHRNSKIVVTDSGEEYADIQTLDDEVDNIEENSIEKPKLDFLDEWDEEDENTTPKTLKLDHCNSFSLKGDEINSFHIKQTETVLNDDEINEDNYRKSIANSEKIREKLSKLPESTFLDKNLTSNMSDLEEENEDQDDEIFNDNVSKPTCMFCHMTFFSLEAVKDHVKLLHGGRQTDLNLDLTPRKVLTGNVVGNELQCNMQEGKNKQKGTVSPKKLYKCNLCGIRKVSYQLIQIHRNIHMRQIALQCKFCGSKLRKLASFKFHRLKCRKIASGLKKCKYCQFKFFNLNDLMKHVKTVHISKFKGNPSNVSELSLGKVSDARNRKRLQDIEKSKAQLRSRETQRKKKESRKKSIKCDSCDLYFSEMSHLLNHKIRHKIQECLKFGICIWCSKLFGDKAHIGIHTENTHEAWLSNMLCSLCDKEFFSKREFKLHLLNEHFPENTQLVLKQMSEYKNDSVGNEAFSKVMKELHDITGEGSDTEDSNTFRPNYSCPLCDFQAEDETEVKNHQISHKNNYCNICQSLFKKGICSTHDKYHSPEFLGEKCTLCSELFHDDIHLMNHLQTVHPDSKNKCNMCTESFITLTDLVKHKCETHGIKLQTVMTCKICEMKFLSKKSFRNHTEFAHRPSPSCKFCDKDFPSLKSLLLHEMKHLTRVKMYKCSTCGKVLRTMSALKAHKVNHFGDSLKSCETCGKKFKTIFFMREHLASHSEDRQKRYHCTVCGRGFYFYDTHCRHRKVHLDPFLYSCQFCKTRFQNNAMLKTHSKTCREEPVKKRVLRNSRFQVELDDSTIEDHEPTLHCEHCSFHTKYEKELNRHALSHFAAPKARKKSKTAVSSLNIKNKASANKKRSSKIKNNKKKCKVIFQCSLCEAVCEDKLAVKIHAKTVHGNVSVVVSDSEGEYEDVQTLEQSDDELIDSSRSVKEPFNHELDFLDDWEDGEIIANPNNCKVDEDNLGSNDSKNKRVQFNDSDQLSDIKETIAEDDNFLRPTCMFCYATFSSFEAVEDHVKLLHEKTNDLNMKLHPQKQATLSSIGGGKTHPTTVENAKCMHSNKLSLKKAFRCNFCGIRKVSFHFIKQHASVHKRKMSLQCKLCGSRFKRISGMKIHQLKCRKISSAAKKCILCRFKFFKGTTLKNHFKNVHLTKFQTSKTFTSLNKNTLKKSKPQCKFRCDQCGEVFKEKGRLNDHDCKLRMQQCLDYNICICCNKIFVDRVHLDIHTECAHPEWFSGKECPICKRGFSDNDSLKGHYLRYHITDELVRQITDYQQSLKERGKDLKQLQGFDGVISDSYKHLSAYNPLLVYNCPISTCMFQSKDNVLIKMHEIKHVQNYCPICKSLFNNEICHYHMKHHSQTFIGRKCTLCKSLFHDSIHLMYHKDRFHQNKCNMCSESFITPEKLAQHRNEIHRKKATRVLTCNECHMKFRSRKALKNHKESLHWTSLNCKHCGKSFNSFKRLIVHENNIHIHKIKSKLITCSTCGKVCKSKDALKLHQINHQDSLNPQRCETCLMHFESFFELKEHAVSHLDNQEKKYFCDICEKGFFFYDSHWRHRKEHQAT